MNINASGPSPTSSPQVDVPAHRDGLVCILMATYNGERFLPEQLASLGSQTWPRIDIIVSDDRSSDGTLRKIRKCAETWSKGQIDILEGPCRGFAENFRSLILNPMASGDYFAFCDQDDIWLEDKLERAIDWLSARDPAIPALYCGRTRNYPDETGAMSPLFPLPPSFRNAIVQSIAGSNTMVMNRTAFELVRKAATRTSFVSHDWFSYMIVSGAGGVVRYDPMPGILYRQHDGNLVGANNTWRARLYRLRFLASGRFARWMETNMAGLAACRDLLLPDAQKVVDLVEEMRAGSLPRRIAALRESGVYRQTKAGQAGLIVACILNLL